MTEHCTDVTRILSETIQMENYIFRKTVQSKESSDRVKFERANDLDLGMNILPELAE